MGLRNILRKIREKEKEMRILILYIVFRCVFERFIGSKLELESMFLRNGPAMIAIFSHNHGLDNAGKTTIMKRINGEDISTISPTLGFNIKTIEHDTFKLNMWDVGGQKSLRSYWRNYFEATDGLIWVVDSADKRRVEDCRAELNTLLQEEQLESATLLVFANKSDLPGSLSVEEIKMALDLDNIKTHHWKILSCSAFKGDNLLEGIDWLVKDISSRVFSLD